MRDSTATRKRLLVAMFVAGFAVLGLEVTAGLVLDAEFVRERLSGRLGDDPTRVSLDEVSFSLLARRIEVSGLVVSRPGVATLYAERVVVSGLPLLALVRGDATPELGRVEVSRPLAFVHPAAAPAAPAGAQGSAEKGTHGRGAVPVVRVGELRIAAGTLLAWRPDAASGPRRVLVRGVEVDGRDLAFDGEGRLTGPRDGLAWSTGSFTRVRADGLVHVAWDSMRASVRDSAFQLAGVRYEPTLPDTAFFGRLEDREDRVRIYSPRVSGRGVEFSLRPDGDFVARTIAFDSTEIDVYSNRRIPDTTASDPWTPHGLVRSFDGRLRVDTVEVSGRITYRELPRRDVREPARFVFDDLDGRITGISNAPDAPPMAVEATMAVFGTPSAIRLEIPLDVDRMLMRMDGRVGSLDLSRLNDLTVPLQGVEIQAGRLEGLRFDITVDGPTAGGTVWVAYRDLDVQMVDSGTGEGGLFDDIESFVANTFVLRGDNMPDEEEGDGAVPGVVEYYVEPDDSFFTRVWAPIRSGLMDVVR